MLQIGSLVDNKYKILSEVGHGGMSVVYLAINERANKTWAVKEIRKDGVCDFEAVKQGLVVETDMLKKLNHNHLPSIIDVIDTEDSFLIVMDYIEGKSLQSVLKKGGAQPTELVVEWGKQLCDVLGYLHSRTPAIIYRDMKPANVMLKPDGNITLIDFGTAREFKDRSMVEDTTCLGTRGYAAPEQFGGRGQTDARTDIYCLGATMYHLITGHSPAEPPYEIKPLSYWNPAFAGSGLEIVINKCCQQDPSARYQNCAELMYDLEHVSDMDYSTQQARKRKWKTFIGSLILCGVGLAGMLTFQLLKNQEESKTYTSYLQQAEQTTGDENFPQFMEYINAAIRVDPSQYEVYDLMISRVEADGRFDTQTELTPIKECLEYMAPGQNKKNEDLLLAADPEGYADIQFRMGKLLFLMSDGEEKDLSASAQYFTKALDTGGLRNTTNPDMMKVAQLAAALENIASHINNMGVTNSAYTESDYSYAVLWEDLENLYRNNSIDSMGVRSYGITLYGRIASLILKNYKNFTTYGVTADQMDAMLLEMAEALQATKADLTELEKSRGFESLIDNALNNIVSAQNMISASKGGNA